MNALSYTFNSAQFSADIVDLFARRRGGHVQGWLYSDRRREAEEPGSVLYSMLTDSDSDYHPFKDETSLISVFVLKPELKIFRNQFNAVADFGTGGRKSMKRKTSVILHGLPNVNLYIPVDRSVTYLNEAQIYANDNFPAIQIIPHNNDFYRDEIDLSDRGGRSLGLFLGSTVGNIEMREEEEFPRERLIGNLDHMGKILGAGNHLLVGFDCTQDSRRVETAYRHPLRVRFVQGLMHDVSEVLKPKGDFHRSAWQYRFVRNSIYPYIYHQCLEAVQKQAFSIGDFSFSIERGERFPIINNVKYPLDLFEDLVEAAHFRVNPFALTNETQTTALVPLLREP